tara:strand:+ start:1419 stop:1904 length:486 start_codon:yes stop_codon:yes gene_type:complete
MDNTAIGSVGAIRAPNNKQSTYVNPYSFNPNIGCWMSQKTPEPTAKVENTTPKLAKNKIVTLSFNRSCTFTLIAPANSRKGNITSISNTLKSKLLVSEVTVDKKSGKKIPDKSTITDKHMAKIIKPIVCGSLSNLRLMIEKSDASKSSTVVISSILMLVVL